MVHQHITKSVPSQGVAQYQRNDLRQRQTDIVDVRIVNQRFLYYMSITLGNPKQHIAVQIDTGSSDLWVNTQQGTHTICAKQRCTSGVFMANESSSYSYINSDFELNYSDGSSVSGDYVTDDLGFGNVTLDNIQFGIGYHSQIGDGIMGIGPSANEASSRHDGKTYANLPQSLVNHGYVQSRAYSLWLNDLNAYSGSILFGGVDTAKYSGNLTTVPLVQGYDQFIVSLLGVGENGNSTSITGPSNIDVLLDSGSSFTYLPDALTQKIYSLVGARYIGLATTNEAASGLAVIDCGAAYSNRNLTFRFARNMHLDVPMHELVLLRDRVGDDCVFGISPASDSNGPVSVIGDTVLRSAYVVYDVENSEVSLAQTVFGTSMSNVVEIGPKGVGAAAELSSIKGDVPSSGGRRTEGISTGLLVASVFAWAVSVAV